MATNSKVGGKEYVEWHSIVAFRTLATEIVEKCTKGPLCPGLWLSAPQQGRQRRGRAA
jgi:hypothetical protein